MKLKENTDAMLKRYETVLGDVRNTGYYNGMHKYIADLERAQVELNEIEQAITENVSCELGFLTAIQEDIEASLVLLGDMIEECEDYLATCKDPDDYQERD